jgi:DNA-binding MarR family transcriptional regulator
MFVASFYMLLLGLGLGFVMQVLIIAVQNAVEYRDLGVATSNAILFRYIGGSLGTALLGAILASQLNNNLIRLLPAGHQGLSALQAINPETLTELSPSLRAIYAESFVASLATVFVVAAAIAFVGLLISFFLPEKRLRETIAAATEADIGGDIGQAYAMPKDTDSRNEIMRGLAVLADRDVLRRSISSIVERARVELSPEAAWLLVQIEREPHVEVYELGRRGKCGLGQLERARDELLNKSLIQTASASNVYALTDTGCDVYNRLVAARRERLAELWPEWSPKKREEVAEILRRLARELVTKTRAA